MSDSENEDKPSYLDEELLEVEAEEDATMQDEQVDSSSKTDKKKKKKKEQSIVQDHAAITANIEIHLGPDASVSTFIFHKESHTMGNSVRHMLMKNKKVSFCGYTVPHPLEAKMNLRLQTVGEKYTAKETLEEGLVNLQQVTETVMSKFDNALAAFTD